MGTSRFMSLSIANGAVNISGQRICASREGPVFDREHSGFGGDCGPEHKVDVVGPIARPPPVLARRRLQFRRRRPWGRGPPAVVRQSVRRFSRSSPLTGTGFGGFAAVDPDPTRPSRLAARLRGFCAFGWCAHPVGFFHGRRPRAGFGPRLSRDGATVQCSRDRCSKSSGCLGSHGKWFWERGRGQSFGGSR